MAPWTGEAAREALNSLGIDSLGLDDTDHRVLDSLINTFSGGPVGLGDSGIIHCGGT